MLSRLDTSSGGVALTGGLCPEGAATYAAYRKALVDKLIEPRSRVVLFNCGSGLKYPMPPADDKIDLGKPIDYSTIVQNTKG